MNQYHMHKQEQPPLHYSVGYSGPTPQSHADNSYSHMSPQSKEYQQQEYQPYAPNDGPQSFVPPGGEEYYGQHTHAQGTHNAGSMFSARNGRFAGLCYLGFWLTGLLFLLFERKNPLIRFHAMQSLLLFGGVNILYIVLIRIMIEQTPFVFGIAIFAFVIMNIIAAVSWFVGMIGAFSGKYTKLPLVGDIAERYVNNTMPMGPRL